MCEVRGIITAGGSCTFCKKQVKYQQEVLHVTETVVIGGGAAGMAAAIAAGEAGEHVILLERMDRVGKKLLATGNGRCNLMNTGDARYPGGEHLAREVLARCGQKEQRIFWETHGLRLREEDGGRVYPASGQATTVLDVLRLSMAAAGVEIVTEVQATGIKRKHGRWTVQTDKGGYPCDRVIIAGGGCAQSKLGSDGSCWPILETLGHRIEKPKSALTQIETDTAPIRGLSGIRVRGEVSILDGGKVIHRERGEALFADYGVSGVCVMQCARYAEPGCYLAIDFLSGLDMSREEAGQELKRRRSAWADMPMDQLMTGLFVPRLASCICAASGVMFKSRMVGSLSDREIEALVQGMQAFSLRIRGIRGFDAAQVVAGGAACDEFDPETMESRLAPGIFAAGEVLDVDGDCGGFNLMFGFGSGILAGLNGRENPYRRTME